MTNTSHTTNSNEEKSLLGTFLASKEVSDDLKEIVLNTMILGIQ